MIVHEMLIFLPAAHIPQGHCTFNETWRSHVKSVSQLKLHPQLVQLRIGFFDVEHAI